MGGEEGGLGFSRAEVEIRSVVVGRGVRGEAELGWGGGILFGGPYALAILVRRMLYIIILLISARICCGGMGGGGGVELNAS